MKANAHMTELDDKLKKITNAFDPGRPASESQYYDLSEVRGCGSFVRPFRRRLEQATDYLSILFTGHLGSGKSSEILQLVRDLTEQGSRKYLAVRVNALEYLDLYDVDMPDLLLAIVAELGHCLRKKFGIELRDTYFEDRFRELKSALLTEVEVQEGEIGIGVAKLKVTRLASNPMARKQVRDALAPRLATIRAELNTLFNKARTSLKKHGEEHPDQCYEDIVIIFDELEKVRRFAGSEDFLESQRELFLERYAQLRGLQAHFVWSVPLRLVRSKDGPQLGQRYDGVPFVLPMTKVQNRDRTPYQPGLDALRNMMVTRLNNTDLSLEEVFTADAIDFLLRYSGGSVRNVCLWVQQACVIAPALPITLGEVRKAVSPTVRSYSTSIPESHWEKLASVDLADKHDIPNGDDDYLVMLENLSLFEYLNGEGATGFNEDEPWYGVNPIVRELTRYKSAVARLSKASSG